MGPVHQGEVVVFAGKTTEPNPLFAVRHEGHVVHAAWAKAPRQGEFDVLVQSFALPNGFQSIVGDRVVPPINTTATAAFAHR